MVSIDHIEDVEAGQLYTQNGNDVWEVKSYFSRPSLILKNLQTGEEMNGGIGCLNFRRFERLVPKNKIRKKIEMPGGFPLGTELQEVGDNEYEVVIPGDCNVYEGKTIEEALESARSRAVPAELETEERTLPPGTWMKRLLDGQFKVVIPEEHDATFYGRTLKEAKLKARNRDNSL